MEQLAYNAWDEPHLARLVADAFAEQHAARQEPGTAAAGGYGSSGGGGYSYSYDQPGSSSQAAATAAASAVAGDNAPPLGDAAGDGSGRGSNVDTAAAWSSELPSLMQLRLQLLDVVGASAAYLQLAMAGGAWREAINRLLKSKER